MWGIYKIDFPNGKSYIGQSCDLNRRSKEYKNWDKKCKNQTALYNAFKKYGGENTQTTILFSKGGKVDINTLNELEAKYIKEYNTQTPNGYNIQSGGGNSSGYSNISTSWIQDHWVYWSEPIINKITGKRYKNSIEWAKNERLSYQDVYQLVDKDSDWIYENEDTLIYPYGDSDVPETIKKAKEPISLMTEAEINRE